MDQFQKYQRKAVLSELRPYVPGEDLSGVSVSGEDTPAQGGMIARNPQNHADQWYVAPEYFAANFDPNPVRHVHHPHGLDDPQPYTPNQEPA